MLCPLKCKKPLESRADVQISGGERREEGLGCIQVPVPLEWACRCEKGLYDSVAWESPASSP